MASDQFDFGGGEQANPKPVEDKLTRRASMILWLIACLIGVLIFLVVCLLGAFYLIVGWCWGRGIRARIDGGIDALLGQWA